jgi:hypothetical protein
MHPYLELKWTDILLKYHGPTPEGQENSRSWKAIEETGRHQICQNLPKDPRPLALKLSLVIVGRKTQNLWPLKPLCYLEQ